MAKDFQPLCRSRRPSQGARDSCSQPETNLFNINDIEKEFSSQPYFSPGAWQPDCTISSKRSE
jgi:hypothetical protein